MSLIHFTVSGESFSINSDLLLLYPNTKLANRVFWNGTNIDRDPFLFRHVIMGYYRNGQKIFVPNDWSIEAIKAELDYFLIEYEEDKVVYENIGQMWVAKTLGRLKESFRNTFRQLFQSEWFRSESDKSIEVQWNIFNYAMGDFTLLHLFRHPSHQKVAIELLKTEFGIHASFSQCLSKGSIHISWPERQHVINTDKSIIVCRLSPETLYSDPRV